MTKIKSFEFQISDFSGTKTNRYTYADRKRSSVLADSTSIDKKINTAIEKMAVGGWDVKDIKVMHYTLHNHTNGGCNCVMEKHIIVFTKEGQEA